jgi:predicted dehydrogenase
MKKINWGIIGTATIAVEKVIPAMQNSHFCRIKAIAARDLEKAETIAHLYKIPRAYGSYQALLNDQAVTAVYIPLPNNLHVPWSINALHAGKHVLCEKPISTDFSEAQKLLQTAGYYPDLRIMEAFMYRFHPQWFKVKELIRAGKIGKMQTIHSFFSFFDDSPSSIVNKAELGGGSLLDIGCYSISLSRFLFEAEPKRVFGYMDIDPRYRIDRQTCGIMDFGEERNSTFTCSTQLSEYQKVDIVGTAGLIEMDLPFIVPPDQTAVLHLHTDSGTETLVIDPCDQYTLQCDQFALSIINRQASPVPLQDAAANMRALEAILESSAKGIWITI